LPDQCDDASRAARHHGWRAVAAIRGQRAARPVRVLDASRQHCPPSEGRGAPVRTQGRTRQAPGGDPCRQPRDRARTVHRDEARLMRCAVIGGGAWGTALADLLAANEHDVVLWSLEPDVASSINRCHENQRFLKGLPLTSSLRATNDQAEAIDGAHLVVYAAPSQHLRGVAAKAASSVAADATLAVATKGIERGTLALMTSVIEAELPGRAVVGISGPSFAAEVVARHPTAIVAASRDMGAALAVQSSLSSGSFRVYTHDDVIGVELGGALKNVMAVATGIVEGVGLGYN